MSIIRNYVIARRNMKLDDFIKAVANSVMDDTVIEFNIGVRGESGVIYVDDSSLTRIKFTITCRL